MFTLTLSFWQVFAIGFVTGMVSLVFIAGLLATIGKGGKKDGEN